MSGVRPPSAGLVACLLADLPPTLWVARPHDGLPFAATDLLLGGAFALPLALAVLGSCLPRGVGTTVALTWASLALLLAVGGVSIYGLGALFLLQALAAVVVAVRRAQPKKTSASA